MKLDASNDFSSLRENHWHEGWPHALAAANDSGFRDYVVTDYAPVGAFDFEHWIDFKGSSLFNRNYLHHVWVILGAYVIAVYGGQRWMQKRPAFDLKTSLAVWNLLLAVFSLLGALRMLPHLVYPTVKNGFVYYFCRALSRSYSDDAVYFWLTLFIWSKYAELLDTAFLVLRKKPVGFLHAYHHVTVTAYCWYSFGHQVSTGIWFASMNYGVHAIMYFYYFLAAVCTKPPRWSRLVTELQLLQMFIGVAVNVAHYYYASRIPNCDVSYSMVYSALIMYASYAVLFAQFFVRRYLRGASRGAKGTGNEKELNGTSDTSKKMQ